MCGDTQGESALSTSEIPVLRSSSGVFGIFQRTLPAVARCQSDIHQNEKLNPTQHTHPATLSLSDVSEFGFWVLRVWSDSPS